MKVISFLTKYSPSMLVLSIIAGVVSGVASSFMIALVNQELSGIDNTEVMVAYLFVGVISVSLASQLISKLSLLHLSVNAVRKMRLKLCDQILSASLRHVERHGRSRLMAALTEDISSLAEALTQFPVQCINVAIVFGCFGYLFYLSWPLAIVFIVLFAIGIWVHETIARRSRPLLERGRQQWDELITHYSGLIDGNKELKLHRNRRKSFRDSELEPTAEKMGELSWGWHKVFAIAETYGQFMYFVLIGSVLFVAPKVLFFEPTVLIGFVLMLMFMNAPISAIVGSFPAFHQASVALSKIESLGLSLAKDDASDIQNHSDNTDIPLFKSIEMIELLYKYDLEFDDRGFSVGPVNFSISPGELVFIVGGNGSGKSSFVRLLAGLYSQDEGKLLLNGNPVTNEDRDCYRQQFTTIFSDYFLFKTFYGLIDESLVPNVERYLARLGLSDKVTLKDGQLSTLELSQGQRKRLALLTAFIENRAVYIFDEWAADQDPEFKRVFYQEILPEMQKSGKTLIVVSHDDSYYHVADRIVRFTDGKIVEDRFVGNASFQINSVSREVHEPCGELT